MSQTKQQERAAAPAAPRARKDWEWFWRIVAALMLLVIAWVVWVLYQITPRSVVTPLAYATQIRPIGGMPQSAGGTATLPSALVKSVSEPAVADLAMDAAQAAARSGAHQASADIQAAAAGQEATLGEVLKLATEISTLPAKAQKTGQTPLGKPEDPAAPSATKGAAGKARP